MTNCSNEGDWADTEPRANTDRTQSTIELVKKIEKLTKQLDIAKEALYEYANEDHWCDCIAGFNPRQIDSGCYGVYGFQEAQEALMKIEVLEK